MQANVEIIVDKLKEIVANRFNIPKEQLKHKLYNELGLRYEIWHEHKCLAEVTVD